MTAHEPKEKTTMTTATREESDVDDTTVDTGPESDADENQTEPRPEPVDELEEATESETGTEDDDDGDDPNGEAARYRRRLRETEAERDTLAEHLESLQRSHLEHLIGGKVDLFFRVSGSTPAEFFDETGAVDLEALNAAQDTAHLEVFGRPRRPGAPFAETAGWGSADGGGLGEAAQTATTPTWSDALQASHRS